MSDSRDKPELETLSYEPKCKVCRDMKEIPQRPKIEDLGDGMVSWDARPKPCPDCQPEQPNQNLMIFEQIEGSIAIALKLLEQLEASNTMQEGDKRGCIWTLDGWRKHNLKHLKGAFE